MVQKRLSAVTSFVVPCRYSPLVWSQSRLNSAVRCSDSWRLSERRRAVSRYALTVSCADKGSSSTDEAGSDNWDTTRPSNSVRQRGADYYFVPGVAIVGIVGFFAILAYDTFHSYGLI